jgi:hypothetical protein
VKYRTESDRIKLRDSIARALDLLKRGLEMTPETTGAEIEAFEKEAKAFIAEMEAKS